MKMTSIQIGVTVLAWCLPMGAVFAQAPIAPAQITQVSGHSAVVIEAPELGTESSRNRPIQRLFNGHGMGCASNFNNLGCGNLCSNLTFMLGSCRAFFGETCTPNAPHFGPGSSHGQNGQCGPRGCGN